MLSRMSRYALPALGAVVLAGFPAIAQPFQLNGPGIDPQLFRITEFASGLNYPVGMTRLDDDSLLVAVSNGSSFFGSRSGSLIRLVDGDGDGVAEQQQVLVDDVPGGKLTALRSAGDLLFVTGQGSPVPISIYRKGATPSDAPTLQGTMEIDYPASWLHPHSALGVRETPGEPGSFDLLFQLGSRTNFDDTTATLAFQSSLGASGDLAGDAVHLVRVTDDGTNVSTSAPQMIATGLRNAAGFAFHPMTGDLFLQDNGIDGIVDANEPTSADELNVIPVDQIGVNVIDFGFPDNYVEYRTGDVIGGGATPPLVAFTPLPLPDGEEGEGPNDIAFAPPLFPEPLAGGMFVTMHGRFSLGGTQNEENPLVFVDLDDNSFFHFISNDEPDVGHLDGLLATKDSLFAADISPRGGFNAGNANTGKIYQIKSLVPEPATMPLCIVAMVVWCLANRWTTKAEG